MNKLVSILVISYNSSKYILQTLDSIKIQTYQDIELIISDDCSTDDTVKITKEWIEKNSSRFTRTEICVNQLNEGITRNCNRGIKLCTGHYLKLIAADDILDYMCIENNYLECEKHGYRVLFSNMKLFYDNDIDYSKQLNKTKYFSFNVLEQNKVLSYMNFVWAPTFFIERQLLDNLDYFDEKYKYMEDHPMWLKLTDNGIKLNFLDCTTVYYRIHINSISDTFSNFKKDNFIINIKFYSSERRFFFRERLKKLIKYRYFYKIYKALLYYLYKDLIILLGNKTNYLTQSVKLILILDPEVFLYQIKKLLKINNKF